MEVEQAKQQQSQDTSHGDSPVLSCYYEHDSDVVILTQDKDGNLGAKIGEFGNSNKSCLKSAYSVLSDSDAIFDLDKSDKVSKTDWGTLASCPDNIAVYNQSVYHIELGLGVLKKENKTGEYNVCPPPGKGMDDSDMDLGKDKMTCTQILGKTLSKVIKGGIIVIQIAAGIIALIKGMIVLIPPLVAKDADAIKKASGTLVKMGIILVLVLIFRPFVRLIGTILDFDITCIL